MYRFHVYTITLHLVHYSVLGKQTRPEATVEIEISEDMQLVHFDFNGYWYFFFKKKIFEYGYWYFWSVVFIKRYLIFILKEIQILSWFKYGLLWCYAAWTIRMNGNVLLIMCFPYGMFVWKVYKWHDLYDFFPKHMNNSTWTDGMPKRILDMMGATIDGPKFQRYTKLEDCICSHSMFNLLSVECVIP